MPKSRIESQRYLISQSASEIATKITSRSAFQKRLEIGGGSPCRARREVFLIFTSFAVQSLWCLGLKLFLLCMSQQNKPENFAKNFAANFTKNFAPNCPPLQHGNFGQNFALQKPFAKVELATEITVLWIALISNCRH